MTLPSTKAIVRQKAVWGPKRTLVAAALVVFGFSTNSMAAGNHVQSAAKAKPGVPGAQVKNYKLDDELTRRGTNGDPLSTSSVIVELMPGAQLPNEFKKYAKGGKLDIINGQVLELSNGQLKKLAANPDIFRVHENRPLKTHNYRTSITVGAAFVNQFLGYTGAGIGIAVLDSGIASWHDDLTNKSSTVYPYGNQRVAKFVDFVNGRTLPYDDNGHGSHVSGSILGNGYDSYGTKTGIAPGASLVSLKVLDANGQGTISNIIAALNWIVQNRTTYNIRVVNLSVGAPIHESYWTDPLTLAAKRVTDLGITVVAAAGNMGRNAAGQLQMGAITAPGNAPWILTVGASSTMGTLTRNDDTMAAYSSSGPTFIDFDSKPDLVAPGTGTVSLAVPGSTFYATKILYLQSGSLSLGYQPYLALSGTSMAAPVVAGSVALMLQANPNLTPNLIKAILQYTAQQYKGYSALRQGAGFLNTLGAVRLAKFYADNQPGSSMPVQPVWSRQVIWGNHRISGGYLNPKANAWATNVIWGAAKTLGVTGENVVWGAACSTNSCDSVVWSADDSTGNKLVATASNVLWGTSSDGLNVVWGTFALDQNVVWGTDCGGADCENVLWGTTDLLTNSVWGSADAGCNVLWGTSWDSNVVWGTSSDTDVTWGSSSDDSTEFVGDSEGQPLPNVALEFGDTTLVAPAPATSISSGTTTVAVGGIR